MSDQDNELCGKSVYWWDGEYEGDCELPKGHLEPFHFDGRSYYDDDGNDRDEEQKNFVALLNQSRNEGFSMGYGKGRNKLLDELEKELPKIKTPKNPYQPGDFNDAIFKLRNLLTSKRSKS